MRLRKPDYLAAAALAMAACATTASGARPVLKSGALTLEEGQRADFDAGEVREEGADIHFALTSLGRRYIKPQGVRVKVGRPERDQPDYARCADTATSSKPIKIDLLAEETHVCIRTDRGHLGYFTVTEPAGPRPGALGLRFTIWETPSLQ